MAFEFQCQCGKLLSAEKQWVGKNARCPSCSTVLIVPDPDNSSSWDTPVAEPDVRANADSAPSSQKPRPSYSQRRTQPRSPNRQRPADELQSDRPSFWKSITSQLSRKQANIFGAAAVIILLLAAVFVLRHFTQTPQDSYAVTNSALADSTVPASSDHDQAAPASTSSVSTPSRPTVAEPAANSAPEPQQHDIEGINHRLVSPAGAAWFDGIRRRGIQLASGEQIALFLDPATSGLSGSAVGTERPQMLSLLALNDADMLVWLSECQVFSQGVTIDDQPADSMLHVLVFPLNRQSLGSQGDTFITFQPGPVRQLDALIAQFGSATETQLWLGQDSQDLGLTSRVYWWGNVGVSASERGQITHVLLRGPILEQ